MKYIRDLHNIDERVLSVSPQIGKDERPFLGIILVCKEHKYCVPLSKPKKKHDNADTKRKKERLIKELKWCNEHERDLVNTARVLYEKYRLKEHFSARAQCIDFMRMEEACKKYNGKKKG